MMNPEKITGERSQSQNTIFHMIPFIWKLRIGKSTEKESRLVFLGLGWQQWWDDRGDSKG